MAYEKIIEPLKRSELLISGITLQVWLICVTVLPWLAWGKNDCADTILNGDVSSTDDVTATHECIVEHRDGMLIGSVCLLLGYPLLITHIYYNQRVAETLLSFADSGLIDSLYAGSWFIAVTIICTIMPAMIIFTAYYDWEFSSGYDYLGYAMQFQFLHWTQILYDCIIIPLGFTGSIPWIYRLVIILGILKSKHYQLSDDVMNRVVGDTMGCKGGQKWVFVTISLLFVAVITFGSFADVFDFDKEGFFSYHGNSQYLKIIVFIAWEFHCVATFAVACRFDAIQNILNDNVEPVSL